MRQLLALLLLLTFAACGKHESSSAPKRIKIEPAMMDVVLGNQRFTCPSENCPDGLGRLFTINFDDANQSHTCSAFLITARHVLTNSHCVYAGKIDLAKTCEGLYFAFPNSRGGYETARCKKILWRDPRQGAARAYRAGIKDVAIVELVDGATVAPLRLNFTGPVRGEKVTPVVVDQLDIWNAKLQRLSCTVKHTSAKTGVVTLSNCPIISGNSGSPVLNEAGEAMAIIFASDDLESRQLGRYSSSATYTGNGLAFTMAFVEELLRSHHLP